MTHSIFGSSAPPASGRAHRGRCRPPGTSSGRRCSRRARPEPQRAASQVRGRGGRGAGGPLGPERASPACASPRAHAAGTPLASPIPCKNPYQAPTTKSASPPAESRMRESASGGGGGAPRRGAGVCFRPPGSRSLRDNGCGVGRAGVGGDASIRIRADNGGRLREIRGVRVGGWGRCRGGRRERNRRGGGGSGRCLDIGGSLARRALVGDRATIGLRKVVGLRVQAAREEHDRRHACETQGARAGAS